MATEPTARTDVCIMALRKSAAEHLSQGGQGHLSSGGASLPRIHKELSIHGFNPPPESFIDHKEPRQSPDSVEGSAL